MTTDARLATPLLVRHARPSDAVALHAACFPDESAERVADYLGWCLGAPGRPTRLVGFLGGELVSHAELVPRQGGRWAELSSLVVRAPLRGLGLGRRTVRAVVRLARRWGCEELCLQVVERETGLVAMYGRWGFQPRGRPLNGRRWLVLPIPATEPEAHQPQPLPQEK